MSATMAVKNSTATRVQKHRAGLRAAGLRPVQIWLPNIKQAGFAEECLRQSESLLSDPQEQESMAWLAAAADSEGWQ